MIFSFLIASFVGLTATRTGGVSVVSQASHGDNRIRVATFAGCADKGPVAAGFCYVAEAVEFVIGKAFQTGSAIDRIKLADKLSELNGRVIAVRKEKRSFLQGLQDRGLSSEQRLARLPALQKSVREMQSGLDSVEREVSEQSGETFEKARRALADLDKSWVNNVRNEIQSGNSAAIQAKIAEGNKAVRDLDSLTVLLGAAVRRLNEQDKK